MGYLWIRGVQVGEQGTEIVRASDWTQVTITVGAPGVTISTSRDDCANRSGMPVPSGSQLIFICPPDSIVYAAGDSGTIVGVATQPLPWGTETLDAIAESLGLREARGEFDD